MAASEAKAFYGDWSARMTHAKASVPDTVTDSWAALYGVTVVEATDTDVLEGSWVML